ncbi:MAG: KxYKxGKxW signal peptide domain-containing protein [Candidatus Thiodiazotropha sp.]
MGQDLYKSGKRWVIILYLVNIIPFSHHQPGEYTQRKTS